MITDEHLVNIGILGCPGIGPRTLEKLLDYLQSIQMSLMDFWELNDKEVGEFAVLAKVKSEFLKHRAEFSLEYLKRELSSRDLQIILKKDSLFPNLLREANGAPALLFVQGNLREHFALPIAVVGTRKITSYGKLVTSTITGELARNGCEIISGFMYGVDCEAHKAALDNDGYTVGVLGYGFDFTYPKDNIKLKNRILDQGGALVTEYLPWMPPIKEQFPQRNRIVAGMAKAVVVTEAAAQSGSKITVNFALEYNRDVYAVPGSITSEFSDGTKDLINDGARLVSSASDILNEYHKKKLSGFTLTAYRKYVIQLAENELEKSILEILTLQSFDTDELCQELNKPSSEILMTLSMLELKGIIQLERGKYAVKS